jgi:NAD(P)-dependent dehydrogenase (short-subunit alcohol dehydrogenase family)
MRDLANELAPHRVRVNWVSPTSDDARARQQDRRAAISAG